MARDRSRRPPFQVSNPLPAPYHQVCRSVTFFSLRIRDEKQAGEKYQEEAIKYSYHHMSKTSLE